MTPTTITNIMQMPGDVLGNILNLAGQPNRTRPVCRLFNQVSDSHVLSAAYTSSPIISRFILPSAWNDLKAAHTAEAHKTFVQRVAGCIFRIAGIARVEHTKNVTPNNLEKIIGSINTPLPPSENEETTIRPPFIVEAIILNDPDAVEALLVNDPISEKSHRGDYVYIAAINGALDCVKVLIDSGPISEEAKTRALVVPWKGFYQPVYPEDPAYQAIYAALYRPTGATAAELPRES